MSEKNKVTAVLGSQNYYTKIIHRDRTFYVDEPEEDGGGDKASHPTGYLLAALASCTAITLRMYAERKGWDVGEIKVIAEKVEAVSEAGDKTKKLVKNIYFGNQITEEQQKRLLVIADKCPVSKMLKQETETYSMIG